MLLSFSPNYLSLTQNWQYNIPRNQLTILTKCYFLVADELDVHPLQRLELHDQAKYINQHGLSRAAIFNAVEASLSRLDTPYIDLSVFPLIYSGSSSR